MIGRPRTVRQDLPPCLYHGDRRGFYFYRVRDGLSHYVGIGKVPYEDALCEWRRLYDATESAASPVRTAPRWLTLALASVRSFCPSIAKILRAARPAGSLGTTPDMDRRTHSITIYFLIEHSAIEYVGRTRQPHLRLRRQCWRRPTVTSVAAFDVPEVYAETVEGFYIDLMQPPGNSRVEGGELTQALLRDARNGALWS